MGPPRCRSDVTNSRSSIIGLAIHFSRFPKHEKRLALMQIAGATEALLCDSTLWERFTSRNVDRNCKVLDGSRKLSCSGKHTANLVPVVEEGAWFLPEDDEKRTYASFSALGLALDKLGLATVREGKIFLDGGDTLSYIKEAFLDLHGPPGRAGRGNFVPKLDWDFAALMTAFVTLGLGTKEARDLMEFMIVMIMNCRTGRSSFDSLVHDGYIKELFEALWAFSRRVKGSTEGLVEAGRAVRALEAARDALAAREGLVALQGDAAVAPVAEMLAPVAALLDARRALADVSVDGALALVGAALPSRRVAFTQARRAARVAYFGDGVDPHNLHDLAGDEMTGGGEHIQACRATVDHGMDTNRQNIEIAGVAHQGVCRAAMARRVRGGDAFTIVVGPNQVRYGKWLRGERLLQSFRVRVRPEDVYSGCSTDFPTDQSVFFTETAYAVVLLMLSVASEIAGRPVTFEEAGINIASVLTELAAFFADKREKWILISAIGRQIGICNDDGTVSWDVDKKTGQRYPGSRYFKAQLPSDEAVQSLRNIMDIVRDPKTKAMIDSDETLEEAWKEVVKQGYDDPDRGPRLWAELDEKYASAAADALSIRRGAFLQSDGNGGLKSVVVAFAGTNIGTSGIKQWHTPRFSEAALTAAGGGATLWSGEIKKNVGAFDLVVLGPGYFPDNMPESVKDQHRAVHIGFIAAATTLYEGGLEGAAMNAELRAHWAAYRWTGRARTNQHGTFKRFDKLDPPSEPLPESLRDEYGRHFETWAADQEAREAAARALLVPTVSSARLAGDAADGAALPPRYNSTIIAQAKRTLADAGASPEDKITAAAILMDADVELPSTLLLDLGYEIVEGHDGPRYIHPVTRVAHWNRPTARAAPLVLHGGNDGADTALAPLVLRGDGSLLDSLDSSNDDESLDSFIDDDESLDNVGRIDQGDDLDEDAEEESSDASSQDSSDEDGALGDGPPPARALSTRRAAAVATENLAEQSDSDSAMDDEDDSSESDN